MTKKTHLDFSPLIDDVQELLAATSHIAEDHVVEARKRLATALENGRGFLDDAREKAVSRAKATDRVIRDHPYEAIGIALGVGALVGLLLRRRD